MRGSPFQNLSVTEAVLSERHFRDHQRKIQQAHPSIVTKDQLKHSGKMLATYNNFSS